MSIYTSLFISREKALVLYYMIRGNHPSNEELESFLEDFCLKERFYNCAVFDETPDADNSSEIESMVLDKINQIKEEEVVPFTAYHLLKNLTSDQFYQISGCTRGYEPIDSEVFYIKKSDVEKYKL